MWAVHIGRWPWRRTNVRLAGQEKNKGKSKGVGEVVGGGSDEWI